MTALVVGAARSGIALANHLTRAGETVRVVDRRPARDLRDAISRMPASVDFRDHIHHVIGTSDIVLVIVGPKWLARRARAARIEDEDDPVRVEVETALREGIPIIPILVGDTAMPRAQHIDAKVPSRPDDRQR